MRGGKIMDRPSAIYESEKQLKALSDVLEGKEYKNTGATNGESKWLKYIAEQIEKNGVGGSSVQPDWNQNDEAADDYIKNKPSLVGKVSTAQIHGEIFNSYPGSPQPNYARGNYSHAEGSNSIAEGQNSHVEGSGCKTTNMDAHAEGSSTVAGGFASHTEGDNCKTTISGVQAHAEGLYTIASSNSQHVQGKYNIEDKANTYAHIVGNGTSNASRSNAHTLDWNGNAWYAGTVEGTAMIVKSSTEGSSKRFKITVDDSGVITATEITA